MVAVIISSSGYSKVFDSVESAEDFFGTEEWDAIYSGIHSEYCMVEFDEQG